MARLCCVGAQAAESESRSESLLLSSQGGRRSERRRDSRRHASGAGALSVVSLAHGPADTIQQVAIGRRDWSGGDDDGPSSRLAHSRRRPTMTANITTTLEGPLRGVTISRNDHGRHLKWATTAAATSAKVGSLAPKSIHQFGGPETRRVASRICSARLCRRRRRCCCCCCRCCCDVPIQQATKLMPPSRLAERRNANFVTRIHSARNSIRIIRTVPAGGAGSFCVTQAAARNRRQSGRPVEPRPSPPGRRRRCVHCDVWTARGPRRPAGQTAERGGASARPPCCGS
jgi:hypothetical protein